jgi:autotransporter-associated beta strand protein
MKTRSYISERHARLRSPYLGTSALFVALVLMSLSAQSVWAGSATWKTNPPTNDWNTANDWSPAAIPNGPSDTATFGTSSQTAVSLAANFDEVNGIAFNPGASVFTITAQAAGSLYISGTGIVNNSSVTQNFVAVDNYSSITFANSATAGTNTNFNDTANGGGIFFNNLSTAGGGTFVIDDAGQVFFNDSSSAGNGNFTFNVSEGFGSYVFFHGSSTAANGIFTGNCLGYGSAVNGFVYDTASMGNSVWTLNGGDAAGGICYLSFTGTSTAGNATLIANSGIDGGNGGAFYFDQGSTGGTARVELFGNGLGDSTNGALTMAGTAAPGMTFGSLEGNGLVVLGGATGATKLTVGPNNLSTVFSGLIKETTIGSSLAKTGRGKFTLSTANTYTGGTTVTQGSLLVTNRIGSATGTGAVTVNGGVFGGTGKVSGAVTVGTATKVATLAPGVGKNPGKLTTTSSLTFNAKGACQIDLNSTRGTADQIVAKGVTITSGATVTISDAGTAVLTSGTVFTIISNTANTAISGTFSNLADGSTLVVGSNTYLASYTGGSGNDLTLTVQ